jgi:hypothetical protein
MRSEERCDFLKCVAILRFGRFIPYQRGFITFEETIHIARRSNPADVPYCTNETYRKHDVRRSQTDATQASD